MQLLLQPEDLEHDDKSNLKLEVVDRKFRGTNFIYTLKTMSNMFIPVFVHSHHIHQHEVEEKFGIMDIVISALKESGTTVLFVEHDMEIVERYVDRVMAFYQGQIICDAPPKQALKDKKVIQYVLG